MDLNQLFPEAEMSRRRARLERFWQNEPGYRTIIVPQPNIDYTNFLDQEEARQKFKLALEHESRLGYDLIPAYKTVIGTPALASAFGGAWHVDDNRKFWIEPIINNTEDVYGLKLPPPMSGLVKKSIDNYRYAVADINGYVPPRLLDMQGPLGTASMMWRQEDFILAMYDNPEAVHHLLSLVTDYIISVFHYYRNEFPDAEMICWPPMHMPQQYGVGITEDFTELMSPDLYREFGLPYVNRIADEFGGVFIHCCARFKQHWDVFDEIHNLRGLDTMFPFADPAEVAKRFPDIAHMVQLFNPAREKMFGSKKDAVVEFICEQVPEQTRLIFLAWESDDGLDANFINAIKKCRKENWN